MFRTVLLLFGLILSLTSCSRPLTLLGEKVPLEGVNITIDPGHGDTKAYDRFRVGPSGEREEWINLRVAKRLAQKLRRAGAKVTMTRTSDKDVSLGGRATLAKLQASDLLVSIHHNGSNNDPGMDLPIVYFFGPANMNPASVDFAKTLMTEMRKQLEFEQPDAGAVYSDHLIYSSGTSILRNSIDHMPGVIGEAGFFTNARGEARLKSRAYNQLEAEVYFQAILHYFENGLPSAQPLLPDTLEYLDLNSALVFELDDGFGSSFFEAGEFLVLQDADTIPASWDPGRGLLTIQPKLSDENTVTFQVFGRNFKGNAIHPIPHRFLTKVGALYFSEEKWWQAFDKAEALFHHVEQDLGPESLALIDEALHNYRLSLDLQIVHPQARQAEEAILVLLIMKAGFFELDLSEEITAQTYRLNQLYPQ